ncbi:MAG: hypothetical protein KGH61_00470 [Candidatus Micrarchaeota archaeon]|nr:hypothetical protein [Candidatus Micrarchaeota archaeon]MDE1847410.1 hypothetical protein [Candidatus Micrarchaeota archaeon]MDE1864095.1 hypothetical protein [Candidatus Micrarchaeota archaeon]
MKAIQIQEEVERLDRKIDNLNSVVSRLVELLEGGKLPNIKEEFKASYAKKLANAMKEVRNGKVIHYKNIAEFNKAFG